MSSGPRSPLSLGKITNDRTWPADAFVVADSDIIADSH